MEQSHSHDSIKNIININKNFLAVIYGGHSWNADKYIFFYIHVCVCEIFDKRTNSKIISENGEKIYIAALDDGKDIKKYRSSI